MSANETRYVARARDYKAVVTGGSAGGVEALRTILSLLPENFALPILVVQHLHPSDGGLFAQHSLRTTHLRVIEPCDKERIERGCIYAAPANYHMLVERNGTISLCVDEKINWSRPSIDVLFESAARAWDASVAAVILSGANADGAEGICTVKTAGGLTIAQDPTSAGTPVMPQAAIDTGAVDEVLRVEEIARLLAKIGVKDNAHPSTAVHDASYAWRTQR